jgi:hypothetical protein
MCRGTKDYSTLRSVVTATTSFEKYTQKVYINMTYDLNAAMRVATESKPGESCRIALNSRCQEVICLPGLGNCDNAYVYLLKGLFNNRF